MANPHTSNLDDIMSDFAKRIAALSPQQREKLLKKLSQSKSESASPTADEREFTQSPPISQTGETVFPLSAAQQRLWFLEQLVGKSPFYNVPGAVEIQGVLDANLLQRCFSETIRRHQVLRTRFAKQNGEPVQIVDPPFQLEMPVVDLQQTDPSCKEEKAQQLAREEAEKPFDLTKSPLLRTKLLRLERDRHLLVFISHHIISDAWSRTVMLRELTALYQAFSEGQPSPLPELSLQYVDFAVWQNQWLQGETMQKQLDYWQQKLHPLPPVLELPVAHSRPQQQTYRGAQHQFVIEPELMASVRSLARQQNATPYVVLLAAFQTLLYRYSGETDIAVGSPIANRNHAAYEHLIGFFANTLVLRSDLSGDPTFLELLDRVRDTALNAYSNQDLPFEKLVEVLQPQRDTSHSPLFQVLFAFHDMPVLPEIPGLSFKLWDLDTATAKFDLSLLLRVDEHNRGIVTLESNTDLFKSETIERLATHWQTLLTDIAEQPSQPISQLSLLPPAERQQVLQTFQATEVAYPETPVHQLFVEQVAQTPTREAVSLGEQALTYQTLYQKANQLARKLRSLGVGPETHVGICLSISPEIYAQRSGAWLPVAVLGVLLAGGAYVPLDPNLPEARLAYMSEDAQIEIVLTHQHLQARLPDGCTTLCLDTDSDEIAKDSEAPLEPLATGVEHSRNTDNLTYTIYTSGSTGQPKGVAMTHRPLNNLIRFQRQISRLQQQGARTLQFAAFSFDVFFQELFATWSAGGTLVLMPDKARRDPNRWLELMVRERIERVFLPFVALSQLAQAAQRRGKIPQSLQEVITAGEQLQITPAIARFFEALPNCQLQNQYGPSETHVVSTYTLSGKPNSWPKLPPIGRPIANAKLYVLDENLQPVPIGVPGELCVGGVSLARGYFRNQQQTDERFITNPFVSETSAASGALSTSEQRLYRTGDRARLLSDGNIEFLGRNDRQVKLRGFRLELAEVEAALTQHPQIQEAAAIVRDDGTGDRLVAYIVCFEKAQHKPHNSNSENKSPGLQQSSAQVFTSAELSTSLRSLLPEYAIPSQFVELEALPTTPSGKIDRRSLPEPQPQHANTSSSYVAPRNELESDIARMWQEILQCDREASPKENRVGINDNFFDLGGHSLLIVQLGDRLSEYLQQEIPLVKLFQYPTIASFVEYLNSANNSPTNQQSHSSTRRQRAQNRTTNLQQQRKRRKRR